MAGPGAGSLAEFVRRYRRVLVYGAGGGGDAVGAVHMYLRVRELGGEPLLAALVWERFPLDPTPGPIPIESMPDAEPLGWSLARVTGETRALRPTGEVWPQVARVAAALGVEAYAVDASKGAEGVLAALEDAVSELGVQAVIGVDIGGDSLALGCEEDLWSPLADAMSVSALARVGAPALLAVQGPGADGELSQETVLDYIAAIASKGGLVGVTGIQASDVPVLERVLEAAVSEASRVPLLAFRGWRGELEMRGGTRRVRVSPVHSTAFLLDPTAVYEWTPLPRAVEGSMGVARARELLNSLCVYTELDLEMDLSRARERGAQQVDPAELRARGREALRRRGCRPVACPGGRGG
ncbi:MAG: DUF1152 domain-containing protein [Desulfurococcales archaeon]|nr:DUF1152 domain-containing protein [Desulfurococcales archaeon]